MNKVYVEKYTKHQDGFTIVSLKRWGGSRMFTKNISTILKEIQLADIVHFQKCFHYVCLPALAGALIYDKPVHYDWDDLEEAIYKVSTNKPSRMIHFFLKTFERILPTIVDTVSVASEELKKKCINLGVPVEKIYDAPVGADLSKYG